MTHLDAYFQEMQKIVDSKNTSSRIRFSLQDTIELRQNKWVPRRETAGPKTIDQIHKEAQREKQMAELLNKNVGGGGGGGGKRRAIRSRKIIFSKGLQLMMK